MHFPSQLGEESFLSVFGGPMFIRLQPHWRCCFLSVCPSKRAEAHSPIRKQSCECGSVPLYIRLNTFFFSISACQFQDPLSQPTILGNSGLEQSTGKYCTTFLADAIWQELNEIFTEIHSELKLQTLNK